MSVITRMTKEIRSESREEVNENFVKRSYLTKHFIWSHRCILACSYIKAWFYFVTSDTWSGWGILIFYNSSVVILSLVFHSSFKQYCLGFQLSCGKSVMYRFIELFVFNYII